MNEVASAAEHDRACSMVLDRLQRVLEDTLSTDELRRTGAQLLDGVATTFAATAPHNLVPVHLPLAYAESYDSIGPDDDLVGVAAACTALYVGGRLLDDVMDGHEVSYAADQRSMAEVLGWASHFITLPMRIMTGLADQDPSGVAAVDSLASGMTAMSAGQLQDVVGAAVLPSADEALAAIRGKTGALVATCSRCAAQIAGHDAALVDLAGDYGVALGVARQLVHDLAKLGQSRAESNWSPPYVVLLHAESLPATERAAFLERVALARGDVGVRTDVVADVAASDAAAAVRLMAEFRLDDAATAVGQMADRSNSSFDRLAALAAAPSRLR